MRGRKLKKIKTGSTDNKYVFVESLAPRICVKYEITQCQCLNRITSTGEFCTQTAVKMAALPVDRAQVSGAKNGISE